jgi:hypothetical protein
VLGVLLYTSADGAGRFFSDRADMWEKDGVIRYGGGLPGNKIWREDSPKKFASRIAFQRFTATYVRWFMKIGGALFAIGGIIQFIGSL